MILPEINYYFGSLKTLCFHDFTLSNDLVLLRHFKPPSLVAQKVKSLPAIQMTWVWSLSQEDPLEKETATYSCILAWEIPWTEEPGRLQSMGSQSGTRLSN